jgi:hypothetical protein
MTSNLTERFKVEGWSIKIELNMAAAEYAPTSSVALRHVLGVVEVN